MAHQKASSRSERGRSRGIASPSRSQAGGDSAADAAREGGLTDVDREVVEALSGFRDALRDRIPLETRYTVRQVVMVEPPPPLTPRRCGGSASR